MQDMIGQRDVCERLRIAIDAARKRGEALGHVLFDGPPGLGKTTFATCIPNEMGVSVQLASGAVLKAPKDLVPYLTNAEERSVLFIDEIHRLPRPSRSTCTRRWRIFASTSCWGKGSTHARTICGSNRSR